MNGHLDTDIAHALTVADNSKLCTRSLHETNNMLLLYWCNQNYFSNSVVNVWNFRYL